MNKYIYWSSGLTLWGHCYTVFHSSDVLYILHGFVRLVWPSDTFCSSSLIRLRHECRRNTQQGMIIRTRSLNGLLNAREEPMFFDLCQLSSIKIYTFVSWFSRFALLKFSSAFAPFSLVSYGERREVISTFTINQMKASDYTTSS